MHDGIEVVGFDPFPDLVFGCWECKILRYKWSRDSVKVGSDIG